jgi:hypothetical protein
MVVTVEVNVCWDVIPCRVTCVPTFLEERAAPIIRVKKRGEVLLPWRLRDSIFL